MKSQYGHVHKIFGFLALSRMIWRMYLMQTTASMGFVRGRWLDLAWIGVHAALHVTSFQFILSNRRNKVYNISWPEMRWHTMIFSYRSIITWFAIWLGIDSWPLRVAIVFATMVCADVVTRSYTRVGCCWLGHMCPR